MIEPPIDKLVKKVNGNKYKLCCLIAKRAKYLALTIPHELETSPEKEISIAAKEIYNGEVVAKNN
jgi:DNA-directed RNA polymerase omega subunit